MLSRPFCNLYLTHVLQLGYYAEHPPMAPCTSHWRRPCPQSLKVTSFACLSICVTMIKTKTPVVVVTRAPGVASMRGRSSVVRLLEVLWTSAVQLSQQTASALATSDISPSVAELVT